MKHLQEKSWQKAALFICTKCHHGIPQDTLTQSGNSGENLKNFLKENLKKSQLNKYCRVMNSSCLGICPDRAQAILVDGLESQNIGPIIVMDPEKEKEDLLKILESHLTSG